MQHFRKCVVLIILTVSVVLLLSLIEERAEVSGICAADVESTAFRSQSCNERLIDEIHALVKEERVRGITVSMLLTHFQPDCLHTDASLLLKYKADDYQILYDMYAAIWEDVEYFPVAADHVTYSDTWLSVRNFQGERLHEGCDLFGEEDVSGIAPIVSMTDGVVEKMGWLPLGGYRLGIRSPHGGYFYYAHLASYAETIHTGSQIHAGEVIGFMGDTGYGTEGTTGRFPVHLHLGIYIRTGKHDELSVNPYWILRYIHKKRINNA